MNVYLMMTRDASGCIGTLHGIPWDCTAIHSDMVKRVKKNVIIIGKNAYAELDIFKKVNCRHKIILTKTPGRKSKHVSYVDDVIDAMRIASSYHCDVYVLGGNMTQRGFIENGIITNILFYQIPGKHEGITFVNSGKYDFCISKIEPRNGYEIYHYNRLPKELKNISPLKVKPPKNKQKDHTTSPLNSLSDSELLNEINNLVLDDSSLADESISDITMNCINEFHDILSSYADNQEMVVDRLNNIVMANKTITACQIAMQDRVGDIEDDIMKYKKRLLIVMSIMCLLIIVGIVL